MFDCCRSSSPAMRAATVLADTRGLRALPPCLPAPPLLLPLLVWDDPPAAGRFLRMRAGVFVGGVIMELMIPPDPPATPAEGAGWE